MNKPVAYIDHISGKPKLIDAYVVQTDYDIPLYIHPVKELTQGEIHAVWASGSYYTLDKEGNVDEVRFEEFAKAVIKKAREK